jgi:leader peptidase (prepilin peptidase)/N-methyltransferase
MNDAALLTDPWVRSIFGFVMGAILGSFATMLVYRLPRHISIVLPRSHCPSCKTVLGVRDLVPIFSWIAMRGRCRHCHAQIGVRYPAIELVCSLACVLATRMIGFSPLLAVAYAIILSGIVVFSRRIHL